jgi:histidinol phosphatase-like enzyme (inositol monophosphatase family)
MQDFDSLMEFAAQTARRAGLVTLEHFGRAAVDFKGDGSEVTAADLAAERLAREILAERFPEDGIVGEEGEDVPSRSGRRWILDPVDGTRSFASGVPLYATLLALEVDGRPVVGCCHLPVTGQTLVAARGAGAWLDGERVRVSECDELSRARLVTSGLEYWRDLADEAGRAGFGRLVEAARVARTWGDAFGYFLVATGRAEIFADPAVGRYWDYAPMEVIVAEAGGRLTQFDGAPVGVMTPGLASNGRLHETAARLLRGE